MLKNPDQMPDFVSEALKFWDAVPKTRGIPAKREFHPLSGLPKSMITQIALARICTDPLDVEITLCGSRLQQQLGKPVVGRSVYEIHDHDQSFARYWLSHASLMIRSRKAVYSEGTFNGDFAGHKQVRRYFFPFSIDIPGTVEGFAYVNWVYYSDNYQQKDPVLINLQQVERLDRQLVSV